VMPAMGARIVAGATRTSRPPWRITTPAGSAEGAAAGRGEGGLSQSLFTP